MGLWVLLGLVVSPATASEAAPPIEVRFHDITTIKQRRVVVPPWSKLPRPIVCKLDFDVSAEGVPETVTPVQCPPELHKNAVKSAMKWTFEPYTRDGVATAVRFRVVLKINH